MTIAYRAAYWISEDAQHEVVLTLPEHAELSEAKLLSLALEEAHSSGLVVEPGRVEVGDWVAD